MRDGISHVASITQTPMRYFKQHAANMTESLQLQHDRLADMIREDILPPFGASLNTFLGNTIGAATRLADQLYVEERRATKQGHKSVEEKHAWALVQDELVADIAEAIDELKGELSSVESEDDPLVRMQGLIRCRDKKEVLGVVMAQTKAEASVCLEGGAHEAAMLMQPVSDQLEGVSSHTDALVQDELRVLRGALESMEALLHDSLAKLDSTIGELNPDVSLDALAKLLTEQLKGLNIDASGVFRAVPKTPAQLEEEYGEHAGAIHKKMAFDALRDRVEQQHRAAMISRLGGSTSFMLRQAADSETLYKHTFTVQPISEDMPPAEIEVEISASVTSVQHQLHDLQASYEAELKRLQAQLAVEVVPLERKYEAEVAHRKRLEAGLRTERAARLAIEAELAMATSHSPR